VAYFALSIQLKIEINNNFKNFKFKSKFQTVFIEIQSFISKGNVDDEDEVVCLTASDKTPLSLSNECKQVSPSSSIALTLASLIIIIIIIVSHLKQQQQF
jgi:hypothetical protein